MDGGELPEGLHGAHGRLEYDAGADALLCRVCGGSCRNLAQHARRAHGLSADEYRELAGLNRGTRLVAPSIREKLRERAAPLIAQLRAEGKLRTWGGRTPRSSGGTRRPRSRRSCAGCGPRRTAVVRRTTE